LLASSSDHGLASPQWSARDRDKLERAVGSIAEQAANTNLFIDEAMEAGLAADHPVTVAAKQAAWNS
jgi:hypothetical protein